MGTPHAEISPDFSMEKLNTKKLNTEGITITFRKNNMIIMNVGCTERLASDQHRKVKHVNSDYFDFNLKCLTAELCNIDCSLTHTMGQCLQSHNK